MRLTQFSRRVTILGLALAVVRACSLTALAAGNIPIGSIDISRHSIDAPAVTVNGEPVISGRTVFNGSSVVTPAGVSATIDLGKAGKVELGPDSSFVISVADNTGSANLTAGNVRLVSGSQLYVNTPASSVVLRAGEVVDAAAVTTRRATGSGISPWVWVAIAGGAAVLVFALTRGGDDNTNGGGGGVASPVR